MSVEKIYQPFLDKIKAQYKSLFLKNVLEEDNLKKKEEYRVIIFFEDLEIKGKLAINTPTANEVLDVGRDYNITWTTTGPIQTIKLDYDSGEGVSPIIQTVLASDESYTWPVPNKVSNNVVVYIEDNGDDTVTDASDAFKIANITIQDPDGDTEWLCETQENIDFTIEGAITKVDIDYSTQGGAGGTWTNLADDYSVVAGSNSFTVPSVTTTTSNQTVVRVKDYSGLSVVYEETPEFVIRGGFTFTDPASGTTLRVLANNNKLIKWTTLGTIDNVYLDYRYKDITSQWTDWAPVNDGSAISNASEQYLWQPAPNIVSGEVELKLTDAAIATAVSSSEAFVIHGELEVVQPNDATSKLKAIVKVFTGIPISLEESSSNVIDKSSL